MIRLYNKSIDTCSNEYLMFYTRLIRCVLIILVFMLIICTGMVIYSSFMHFDDGRWKWIFSGFCLLTLGILIMTVVFSHKTMLHFQEIIRASSEIQKKLPITQEQQSLNSIYLTRNFEETRLRALLALLDRLQEERITYTTGHEGHETRETVKTIRDGYIADVEKLIKLLKDESKAEQYE